MLKASKKCAALLSLLACAGAICLTLVEFGAASPTVSAARNPEKSAGRNTSSVVTRPVAVDGGVSLQEFVGTELDELHRGEMELAGEVADATGGSVAGAVVTVSTFSGTLVGRSRSGADGAFALHVKAGPFQVCARADAYSEACAEATAPSNGHVLTLVPASSIVGKVLERATGRPISGVSVVAANHNGLRVPERRTLSAEDGSFSIGGLAAGGYELVATSTNSRSRAAWVAIGVGETSSPVTLWAESAVSLSGVVLLGNKPCSRGQVQLSGPIAASQQLLSDGSVRFDGVIPGRYEAIASCGAVSTPLTRLDVGSETLQHTWRLEPIPGLSEQGDDTEEPVSSGGMIRATIDGTLDETSRLFAEDGGMLYRARRTGPATFLFEGLPPAAYRVFIDDGIERAKRAEVARDGEIVEVQLTSQAPAWIVGQVTTDTGIPVPDAWVSSSRSDTALSTPARPAPVLTDDQGAFRLPAVPEANYTVTVASPLGDSRADGAKVGRELLLRVALPASLTARVQTAEGGPVPDFTLSYGRLPGSARIEQRGARSTCHVPALEPGRYRLQVTSAFGSITRDIELTPAEEATVTMTLGAPEHG